MQVALLLRKRIEEGEWAVGNQLPTLEELMSEYGVSRATMRGAMDDLEREGLIERGRGRGTFVIDSVKKEHWLMLPTEWDGFISHIETLNTRVEVIDEGAETPVITNPSLKRVPAYWSSRRVNWTDTAPYSMTNVHVDRKLFQKYKAKFRAEPVLTTLNNRFPEQISKVYQVLTITSANIDVALHLKLEIGAPVAVVSRTIVNADNFVIYEADVVYPASQLRIESEMSR